MRIFLTFFGIGLFFLQGVSVHAMSFTPGTNATVEVSASVVSSVKPGELSIDAYCTLNKNTDKRAATRQARSAMQQLRTAIGVDGSVRRTGAVYFYEEYEYDFDTGDEIIQYTADFSVIVEVHNRSRAQAIYEILEGQGCAPTWAPQLSDDHLNNDAIYNQLVDRLNVRKAFFERLLATKLEYVVDVSLETYMGTDQYYDDSSSYDPESDTVKATTILHLLFELNPTQ